MKNIIKRVLPVLIMVAIGGALNCISAAEEKPQAKVEKSVHDFGMIKEDGGPVSCEFTITNKGEGNLIIIDGKADCGCTRPEFPKAPIGPGQSGKVKVTYNPLGRPGGFDKVVTLRTNGNPSKLRLKIKGTVTPKAQ